MLRFGTLLRAKVFFLFVPRKSSALDSPLFFRDDAEWLGIAVKDARVHVVAEGCTIWHRNGVPCTVRWVDIEHLGCSPTFLGGTPSGNMHFVVPWKPEMADLLKDASSSSLRDALPFLKPSDANVLGLACGLLTWQRNSGYCTRCGGLNEVRHGGHSKHCAKCDYATWPRIDPAVIMLVSDPVTKRCVLGRNAKWEPGRFSTLAGFVELGESLEDAVVREVFEEVGIHVVPGSVRYHGSQPWPFPQSLMLGFFCQGSGDIVCKPDEIEEARWFTKDEVFQIAKLPGPTTIARSLLDSWLKEHQ